MAVEKLLKGEERLWAPEALRQGANLKDFWAEYRRSLEDPEGFWGAWARRFYWEKPFEKVLEWDLPEHRWFLGGTTNAVYNALERNVERGLRNKVALLYLAEDGREEKLTYGELLDRVRRLATGLRRLGVQKGDRVVVYMPLTWKGSSPCWPPPTSAPSTAWSTPGLGWGPSASASWTPGPRCSSPGT